MNQDTVEDTDASCTEIKAQRKHAVAYLILAIFVLCCTGLLKQERPTFSFFFNLLLIMLFYSFVLPARQIFHCEKKDITKKKKRGEKPDRG